MLRDRYEIEFNQLFTITNMPIKRFLFDLKKSGQVEQYMAMLAAHFNETAFDQVMCRRMISVGWDGKLFDCDFNQMLELALNPPYPKSLADLESFADLENQHIRVADHCYGCTAGSGSSCRGSLT
jgi:radical SAM/Cys-rich protein